ncbi:MAG: radical SAM protein [Candidatus Stygibacter australis]|nr:radical SAM protein [Candidatus Stygibacter australis]
MAEIDQLLNCRMCPRNCGINRYQEIGYCRSGALLKINTWQKHFGEEPYISGMNGSGTIFFSSCNLSCVFCQNYQISQLNHGKEYTIAQTAEIMLELQSSGVHNINLVTPSHFSIQLIEVLQLARKKGLSIPVVWNTNSYEKVEILRELGGLVDIYLADFKYASNAAAEKLSQAKDYFSIATKAIREMYRQTGHIMLDEDNIAIKGLAIRMLVLPEDANGTEELLKWLADNIGNDVLLSLMSQYYPAWQADKYPETARSLSCSEYELAMELAEKYGFENCLVQELDPSVDWTPDFNQ